jgi:cytochrome c-type protein NapB
MTTPLNYSLAIAAACFAITAFAADPTKSIRGIDVAAPDPVAAEKAYTGKRPGTQQPIARTFSTQPPVIPHALENFNDITLEDNQCMDCHASANFKKKNAPMAGESHFIDREGKKLPEVSAARHNCVQCHVPQVDAPPLVDNVFRGDTVVKKPDVKKTSKKN